MTKVQYGDNETTRGRKRLALGLLTIFSLFGALIVGILALVNGATTLSVTLMVLIPSLFYTSLVASAAEGTRRMRRFYRIVGLVMCGVYFWFFRAIDSEDLLLAITFTLIGIVYCFLVDLCTAVPNVPPASLRELWRGSNHKKTPRLVMETTGSIPSGLEVAEHTGEISGFPEKSGEFTQTVGDVKTSQMLEVSYVVNVRPTLDDQDDTAGHVPPPLSGNKVRNILIILGGFVSPFVLDSLFSTRGRKKAETVR